MVGVTDSGYDDGVGAGEIYVDETCTNACGFDTLFVSLGEPKQLRARCEREGMGVYLGWHQ